MSWHKKEHENLMEITGIQVDYKAPVQLGVDRGSYSTIGDADHVKILIMYAEEGLSYGKIAEALKRSSKTPFDVVKKHNTQVNDSGYCDVCRRGGGEYETSPVRRDMFKDE